MRIDAAQVARCQNLRSEPGVVFGDAEMKENTSGEFLQAFDRIR